MKIITYNNPLTVIKVQLKEKTSENKTVVIQMTRRQTKLLLAFEETIRSCHIKSTTASVSYSTFDTATDGHTKPIISPESSFIKCPRKSWQQRTRKITRNPFVTSCCLVCHSNVLHQCFDGPSFSHPAFSVSSWLKFISKFKHYMITDVNIMLWITDHKILRSG